MKTTLLACCALLLGAFLNPAKAQVDSSAMPDFSSLADTAIYDMGRVTMKKKFTQAITIHAADLEKMPFTDLKEALALYLNGVYTQQQKFAYVIDGLLNTDVNALSIYDIDEITVVQNAASVLNGALPSQVLVLIKTKRGGPGKRGIVAAGQVNQVKKYFGSNAGTPSSPANKGNTTNDLYQQYYVSAYVNTRTTKAGISADLQHNVFPQYWNQSAYGTFKPLTSNRLKFNGYFETKLDESNILTLTAGFVPQKDKDLYNGVAANTLDQRNYDQKLSYGTIQFKSYIADLFTNNLSAGFQRRDITSNWTFNDPNTAGNPIMVKDSTSKINSLVIKDDFSYQGTIDANDDLLFNANINATYRESSDTTRSVFTSGASTNTVAGKVRQKLMAITPSVTFNYADQISLQIGAQQIVHTNAPLFNGSRSPKTQPFASLNVDILKILGATDSVQLRRKFVLHGSYASSMTFADDMTGSLLEAPYYRILPSTGGGGGPTVYNEPVNPYQTFNQLQGGVTFSWFTKGLTFSYNYSNTKFNTAYFAASTTGPTVDSVKLTPANVIAHRAGLNFALPNAGKFKWNAGINASYITNKGAKNNYTLTQLRIFYPGEALITAGFTSQVSYNNAFAGVGLTYDMSRGVYNSGINAAGITSGNYTVYSTMVDGLRLQNLYLGYRLKSLGFVRYMDVFINARNLYQQIQIIEGSVPKYAPDDKKFIGGGIKLEI